MIKTKAAYDAAKAALDVERSAKVPSTYAIANLINDLHQYRRENNIFDYMTDSEHADDLNKILRGEHE